MALIPSTNEAKLHDNVIQAQIPSETAQPAPITRNTLSLRPRQGE